MQWETTYTFAGRQWLLRFTPTLDYLTARQTWQPWAVMAGGMLFTGMLGAFLLVVTGRTASIERLVTERTSELSRANTALKHEITERKQEVSINAKRIVQVLTNLLSNALKFTPEGGGGRHRDTRQSAAGVFCPGISQRYRAGDCPGATG